MIQRERRRAKAVAKYATKRAELRAIIKSPETEFEEKMTAVEKLQKMPRDSAKVRGRNRCSLTGRPHGYYRKFALGRNKLRQLAMQGDIPGLVKASW